MSNPKVFEYAKEIGMTPLALMDKIKEWQLPVKSHMAELDPDVLVMLKQKLEEPKLASRSTDAPKRKAASAVKAAPKAATKAATKTQAIEAPVKASTITAKASTAAAPAVTPTPVAKPGSVVRRKAKTAEEIKAEQDALAAAQEELAEEKAATPIAEIQETVADTVHPVAAKAPEPLKAPAEEAPANTAPAAVVAAKSAAEAGKPAASAPGATIARPAEETAQQVAERKIIPRKKEVSIGNSGIESTQHTAIIPKRNIIGRMDLSRVQSPNQQRPRPGGPPSSGGPVGAGGVGLRPARHAGNLRAGFVQSGPATPEPPAGFDNFDRKREDKRRSKGGVPEGPSRVTEGQSPQGFDAAEFRKREMVFQPKKKKGLLSRPAMHTTITTPDSSKRLVKVYGTMKVSDFANEMKIKVAELIKALMKNGVMATMNTDLDFETIALIAPEFKFEAQMVKKTANEVIQTVAFGDFEAELVTRPPVVTIMGHVDHGKTSLLDAIRNADVAGKEAGGITQHIGAYQVHLETGQIVTFLDTPGHEAFTQMRARGANVTDIAVVVVAADDGVMPQTAEAINHAKAAGVPLIIAVNKMDKPGANPERVKQQLTEYQVVPEEWGGDTIFCPVSAIKKTGIKELLEQILLVAEIEDLKANPKRSGTGAVIESRLDKGRGPVATILVHDGTVKVGQSIVAGAVFGRVRSLTNERGEKLMEAGPGTPVELLGLDGSPQAGDQFDIVVDDRAAEAVANVRREVTVKTVAPNSKMSLEDLFSKVKTGDMKELAVVLKADVAGSLEAINGMFTKLQSPEVKVKVIHSAVGGITENDVLLASAAKGIVVGFGVRPDNGATQTSKRQGVEIRTYSIVYELMDDMKLAMAGMLQPDIVEKVMGRAEVRNIFTVPKIGTIAGTFVTDGKIQRSNMARLLRDGKIIYEGKLASLKRFKDDAKEVASGFECGIGIENFNDVKVGDIIEAFIKEETKKELTLNSDISPS